MAVAVAVAVAAQVTAILNSKGCIIRLRTIPFQIENAVPAFAHFT
jgi:hypothetical protein